MISFNSFCVCVCEISLNCAQQTFFENSYIGDKAQCPFYIAFLYCRVSVYIGRRKRYVVVMVRERNAHDSTNICSVSYQQVLIKKIRTVR